MKPGDIRSVVRGTARADYTSRIIEAKLPTDYYDKVKKCWGMYNTDPLVRFLIDRTIKYAVNGHEWQVKDKKEQQILTQWSRRINLSTPNTTPGLGEIIKWAVKHLQISGVAHMHWIWESMDLGKETGKANLPSKMVVENPLSVSLQRTSEIGSEKIYLKRKKKDVVKEGAQPQASPSTKKGDADTEEVSIMGAGKNEEMFSIKYNFSSGDLTTILSSSKEQTGQAIFPEPPILTLLPATLKRQSLDAADLAIIDGIQHYLLLYKIGDKDNRPVPDKTSSTGSVLQKGTITMLTELLKGESNVRVSELFLPYYIDIDFKIPPVETLLSLDKYVQPMIEIFYHFGLLTAPGGKGAEKFEEINIANFEERVDFIREEHVKPFLETLALYIAERNNFSTLPKLIFNPVNTKSDNFFKNLQELIKLGKLSSKTLHSFVGIDHETEVSRITDEVDGGLKEKMDENTPVSYKQTTVSEDGKTSKQTDVKPALQKGRPKGE